jgi:hypothetical protein
MRVMVGFVGLATATALAACGGGEDGPDGATPAATDYASCLRANGVTLPSGGAFPSGRPSGQRGGSDGAPPSGRPGGGPSGRPGGGFGGPGGGGFGTRAPNGVDQATWEKAQKACEGLRAGGAPGSGAPGGDGNRGGDNGAQAAYRNCLTENGVTVTGNADNLDMSDPEVAAAVATCAPLRPSATPTPSS